MAIADRSYGAGTFHVDVGGHSAGFVKKFSGLHLEGDVVTHDLGPANLQKKNIGNFKWVAGKLTCGIGMGKGLYDWIKASFDMAQYSNHGAITSGDFNYKAQSRCEFRDGVITKVTVPKLDASSKDAAYFDIEWEAEVVRWSKAGGEDIRGKIGPAQKQWLCSNFKLEIGSLPCSHVSSIDTFSWTCSVAPDQLGGTNEPTKHPCKVSVPNLKFEISMKDYQAWADAVHSWFIDGNRHEDKDEMHGRLVFMDTNLKDELGEIALENVGFVALRKNDLEANAEKIARFGVEVYVERMVFKINKYDA